MVREGRYFAPPVPTRGSIHAFLRVVRAAGFLGVPMPVGIDDDGRERLEFIDGEVPAPPYPDWSQSDAALTSIAELLRGLHDASRHFDPRGFSWSEVLADPVGGTVVCHNDTELSNVVFRGGVAIALIDFEFAAPGRPIYDLAQLARLCVPIEDEVDQARMRWKPADRPARLRLIADAYGLDSDGRAELLAALDDALDQIEAAALRSIDDDGGSAAEGLQTLGGIEKYHRRRSWWQRHRHNFARALR